MSRMFSVGSSVLKPLCALDGLCWSLPAAGKLKLRPPKKQKQFGRKPVPSQGTRGMIARDQDLAGRSKDRPVHRQQTNQGKALEFDDKLADVFAIEEHVDGFGSFFEALDDGLLVF